MPKMTSVRRLLLPCCGSSSTATATAAATSVSTTKKRLSASLRDDIPDDDLPKSRRHFRSQPPQLPSSSSSCHLSSSASSSSSTSSLGTTDVTSDEPDDSTTAANTNHHHHQISQIPHRPSKSMVISTFFGRRRSRVWFCVQPDRLTTKPSLLLELSLTTQTLLKEMRSGVLRIALECSGSEIGSCRLHSVPLWTLSCNGRRVGFAARRKVSGETRSMLKKMQNMTIGAGVLPPVKGSGPGEDADAGQTQMVYMRTNCEWVVGSPDSESFHLINPDDCSAQELSVFLLRSWR